MTRKGTKRRRRDGGGGGSLAKGRQVVEETDQIALCLGGHRRIEAFFELGLVEPAVGEVP